MPSSGVIFAFGFANLPLLWWLAAAGAPLVIHLLNRRKYREVSFAAIEYLLAAVRKNSRRIQIEQWLLLAVRTLLIVLLVLAVAELFFEFAGRKFLSGRRTHRVLVLDGSYSMGYQPADATRFQRAKDLAESIVRSSPQGDGFTLVLMGEPPRAIISTPAFDRETVAGEIAGLALPHGGADLPATLEKVEEVLATARREQPRLVQEEVLLLSDLGRVGWVPDFAGPAEVEAFRRRAARLGEETALAVIDLGQPAAANLAVTDLRALESAATLSRDVTLEAEVGNFGDQPRARQLVEFFVDGRRAGEDYVDVAPGQRGTAAVSYRFDRAGDHTIEARAPGDALAVDNSRWLSLRVQERFRVLCINGRPSGEPFRGATDYLTVALSPAADEDRALVQAEVAAESALLELDLRRYDAVFLANVAQFTASEAQVLFDYAQQGGGVVFFLGDQVQADNYNLRLGGAAEGSVRLLPARLGQVVSADRPLHFNPLEYQHELVRPFAGNERAGLLSTQVYQYVRLEVPADSAVRVALALSGEGVASDPAIVEEKIGRGRSIVVATSADVPWTTWPAGHAYVPVVQELLNLAVRGRQQERNLAVGQPLSGDVSPPPADLTIEIEDPAGRKQSLHLQDEGDYGRWTHDDTFASGRYVVRLGPPVHREEIFGVNVDTRESDLAKLEVDELRGEVWPNVDFRYDTRWQAGGEAPAGDLARRSSLARWFLYPVLALLLLEPLLAWKFGTAHA